MTESDFMKMVFNAKTKAEEEYRNAPFEWKPVIYESQLYSMEAMCGPERWAPINAWVREQWEVIDDSPRIKEVQESWALIHKMLDDQMYKRINLHRIAPRGHGKTRLGSQIEHAIIDEMAEVRQVSNVRDLGYSIGPLHLDAEGRLRESINGSSQWRRNEESPAVQLQEWLQRRGICRRALPCGLS